MNKSIGLLFIWSLCVSMHSFALPATPYWKSMQSAGSNAFDSLKKHPRIIAATAAFLFAAKFGIAAYKNSLYYRFKRKEMMLNYYEWAHDSDDFITQDLNGDIDQINLSNPPTQPDIAISPDTQTYNVFHPFFDTLYGAQPNISPSTDNSPLFYLQPFNNTDNLTEDSALKKAALDFILSSHKQEKLLLGTKGRLFFYIPKEHIAYWYRITLRLDSPEFPDKSSPRPNIRKWEDIGWSNLAMMPENKESHIMQGLNRWGKALEWAREYIKAYPKMTRGSIYYDPGLIGSLHRFIYQRI